MNSFSNVGVLPVNFIRGDSGAPEFIKITKFSILCEAIGGTRGSTSSVSVLLSFDQIDHSGTILLDEQL